MQAERPRQSGDTHTWKEDEVGYCQELLHTNGNVNVPSNTIRSYLMVQIISARQDKREDAVEVLQGLLARFDGRLQ